MRIWDLSPGILCRQHLLGEHRELHALWTIISENKKGYSHHPETLRWVGKLSALYKRHEELVSEMEKRDYSHHSPLSKNLAIGITKQKSFINSLQEQEANIRSKKCQCKV